MSTCPLNVYRGVALNIMTKQELIDELRSALDEPAGQMFVGIYASMVRAWARDAAYAELLRSATFRYPDGMGIVYFARLASSRAVERVATTDLFGDVIELARSVSRPIVAIGGSEAANRVTVEAIRARGTEVSWRANGYERYEKRQLHARLSRCDPALVLVGLGVGAQERFCMDAAAAGAAHHVYLTCGGLFDHVSGATVRAPRVIQDAGLEWLWRTIQEPRRLALRYLLGNSYFIARVLIPTLLVSRAKGV